MASGHTKCPKVCKLMYFDVYGRAEPIRLMLAKHGCKYEDCRLSFDQWPPLKPKYGSLPVVTLEGGMELQQSLAIFKYVSTTCGFDPETPLLCHRGQMLHETLWTEWCMGKIMPAIQNLKGAEREAYFADGGPLCCDYEKYQKILCCHLKDDCKFIAGNKMTFADFTVGAIWLDLVCNPNAVEKECWCKLWENCTDPKVKKWVCCIEEELKDYLCTRNEKCPRPF